MKEKIKIKEKDKVENKVALRHAATNKKLINIQQVKLCYIFNYKSIRDDFSEIEKVFTENKNKSFLIPNIRNLIKGSLLFIINSLKITFENQGKSDPFFKKLLQEMNREKKLYKESGEFIAQGDLYKWLLAISEKFLNLKSTIEIDTFDIKKGENNSLDFSLSLYFSQCYNIIFN